MNDLDYDINIANNCHSDMAYPICSKEMKPCFTAQVLGKYPAQYELYNEFGFLRPHESHWLEEAYLSVNLQEGYIGYWLSVAKVAIWTPQAATAC